MACKKWLMSISNLVKYWRNVSCHVYMWTNVSKFQNGNQGHYKFWLILTYDFTYIDLIRIQTVYK